MKKDAGFILVTAAWAALACMFKHSFIGTVFAVLFVISLLLFIFGSITYTYKMLNEKDKTNKR